MIRWWTTRIDEALAGYCDEVTVTIHSGRRGVGRGQRPRASRLTCTRPRSDPRSDVVLTVLHSGGESSNTKVYQISGGLHGVGVSVVNALSEHLTAEVFRDGKAYRMDSSGAKPVN